jgi:hypothetical protein
VIGEEEGGATEVMGLAAEAMAEGDRDGQGESGRKEEERRLEGRIDRGQSKGSERCARNL